MREILNISARGYNVSNAFHKSDFMDHTFIATKIDYLQGVRFLKIYIT